MMVIMHGGCYAAMAMQVGGVQNFVIVWKTTVQGGDIMMPVLINQRRVNVDGTARSFEEAYEELKKRDDQKGE